MRLMLIKRNDSLTCCANAILSSGTTAFRFRWNEKFRRVCYEYYFRNDLFITFGQKTLINHIAARSKRNDCFGILCADGWTWTWMDVDGASAGRANRSVDNDKQVGKEKLLQFSAIFGWPTETLSDDKTCRSASVRRAAIGNVRARAMMRHKHMVRFGKDCTTKVDIILILLSGRRIIMNGFRILYAAIVPTHDSRRRTDSKINVFFLSE